MKVSPSKDNPQGSIYFSQSSNVLSPHDSNDGIDKLKSLSTSEFQSQWHRQNRASIVSDSEETFDKPSSRFPSYAYYQGIFIPSTNSSGFATIHNSSTAVPLISKSNYTPSRTHHYRKKIHST
jgi:hypothetical protein